MLELKRRLMPLVMAVFVSVGAFGLVGCEDGRMEEAGERMDEAGDEMEDEFDDLEDDLD